MAGGAGRHAKLAAELSKWWEDLWQAPTGSRVVLVCVPRGWGRRKVLDRFAADIADRDDAPVTFTVRIDGQDLRDETIGVQAAKLRACLAGVAERHRAAELLGLDQLSGRMALGLGVGGLFFSGPTAGISFLLAGLAVTAAGKAWDGSPAGQDGALARTARAVAAVSVQAPVVMVVDDADCLDHGLAVTLVENLTARRSSQVLIVAAADPGSALTTTLTRHGLVHVAGADPDMGYQSRLELARQLCPNLPDAAARRIAQRTTTFDEVSDVAAALALAELGQGGDEGEVLATVDAAATRLARPAPSPEAVVLAWAEGPIHARQADRALRILGAPRADGDPDVRRWEALARLAGPVTPRLKDQVTAELTAEGRHAMAAAFLEEALAISQVPGASLVDKVAALQAAHRVRDDLPGRRRLPKAQAELVVSLEALGDQAAALQVATEARAGWPAGGEHQSDRDALDGAILRLSRATPQAAPGPLAEQLIAEAVAGGAAVGLEARIWAAIVLLDTPGQREAALTLADQAAADLDARTGLGTAGDQWRLLLAYHSGRGGLTDLATRLLTPLITSGDPELQKRARVVQRAVAEPGADIRLQNILLEAELDALPPEADDDRLRVHHALAANYAQLGDYSQALVHGQHELGLRIHILGPRHPGTLATRHDIAHWTGESGDPAGALRLYLDLLPDMEQVLGPRHPDTLATRANIAYWTGESGDPAGALHLYEELLPDMEQVLGRYHPDTLYTRGNIARWTGLCGNPAGGLRLCLELLPDMEQVFGPRHPSTLTIRHNLADSTGESGDPAEALRLNEELLPDREQVLGPRHPSTLSTRASIACWTGLCGNPAGALRLYLDLLPDQEQVLGPRHPSTLSTRASIAALTGESGDPAGALRLYLDLLPDQEQLLGPRHPSTLTTRAGIARLTRRKRGDR